MPSPPSSDSRYDSPRHAYRICHRTRRRIHRASGAHSDCVTACGRRGRVVALLGVTNTTVYENPARGRAPPPGVVVVDGDASPSPSVPLDGRLGRGRFAGYARFIRKHMHASSIDVGPHHNLSSDVGGWRRVLCRAPTEGYADEGSRRALGKRYQRTAATITRAGTSPTRWPSSRPSCKA